MFIQIKNLSKIFKKNLAVDKINFHIEKNKTLGLLGPNGCGKTTSIGMMLGLIKPSEGEIIIDNKSIYKFSEIQRTRLRNEKIGFIFQFHFLIKELSARENVALPAIKKGDDSEDALERADQILYQLGLGEKLDRFANKLSGGEQQRDAIARALINSPSLILADEPTGNLDTANSEIVFDLLQNLSREQNLAVLLVTHNNQLAKRCDRFISMNDGLIVD